MSQHVLPVKSWSYQTCLSSTWIVRVLPDSQTQSYKIVTNCKYNDCSVYALYLPSLIELWDLDAILHGNARFSVL